MRNQTSLDEQRILLLTRVGLAVFWALAIGYVVIASVMDHPLRASYRERQNLIAISPQGWAFFTRNPRESVERIYQRQSAQWRPTSFSNSSPRNLFGVRRAARAVSAELASMLGQIPQGRWTSCTDSLDVCLRQASPPIRVENKSTLRTLCGEVAVERRPPVPWAWSRRIDRINMPGKVLRFTAVCPGRSPEASS